MSHTVMSHEIDQMKKVCVRSSACDLIPLEEFHPFVSRAFKRYPCAFNVYVFSIYFYYNVINMLTSVVYLSLYCISETVV